jgi:hypothetical protein
MLSGGARMCRDNDDFLLRLLAAAVRRMPPARVPWGQAMLAELAYVHGRLARWTFALSCVPVALFPPGGPSMHAYTSAHFWSPVAVAAATATAIVAPLAVLEVRNQGIQAMQGVDNVVLFGLLWLAPAAVVLLASPVVRAVRSGAAVLDRPLPLLARLVLLMLVTFVWLSLVADQLPCFMGVPNCD